MHVGVADGVEKPCDLREACSGCEKRQGNANGRRIEKGRCLCLLGMKGDGTVETEDGVDPGVPHLNEHGRETAPAPACDSEAFGVDLG